MQLKGIKDLLCEVKEFKVIEEWVPSSMAMPKIFWCFTHITHNGPFTVAWDTILNHTTPWVNVPLGQEWLSHRSTMDEVSRLRYRVMDLINVRDIKGNYPFGYRFTYVPKGVHSICQPVNDYIKAR